RQLPLAPDPVAADLRDGALVQGVRRRHTLGPSALRRARRAGGPVLLRPGARPLRGSRAGPARHGAPCAVGPVPALRPTGPLLRPRDPRGDLGPLLLLLRSPPGSALPVLLLAMLSAVGRLVGGVRWVRSWPSPETCLPLAAFCLGHLLFLSAMPYAFFRYVVTLLPVCALLTAASIVALGSSSRALGAVALALVLLVDRADLGRGVLDSTLWKYVRELTNDQPGPIAGMVSFFRAEARP